MISEKRAYTSRSNGSKGRGPVSPEGKVRSSRSARKLGLFAKDLVIADLGESETDLERVRQGFWASCKPQDFVEEKLCEDLGYNWWYRERVRRCNSGEIRKVIFEVESHANLDRAQEVALVKARFMRLFNERRVATSGAVGLSRNRSVDEIDEEIDEVRRQLHGSSGGLDFLIETLEAMANEADANGQLRATSLAWLDTCLGTGHICGAAAKLANSLVQKEMDAKHQQEKGTASASQSDRRPGKGSATAAQKAAAAGRTAADELI